MSVHKISAVIITLNEESNIERCLKSLLWTDEIIIYDSGSTDATVSIAEKMGAKVIKGQWLGFGPTKNKATQLATHDWILSIDADEEVSEKLAQEIKNLTYDISTAYKIPRLSFFMGRWIKFGGWYPDAQLRFFNKKKYQWNQALIHEKVQSVDDQHLGQTIQLKNNLYHYVFKSIEHQVATNNKYSSLQAQEMFKKGKKFSYFHLMTKPYVKFIECYFLKRGLLDGWAGYVISRNAAYSVFLKWVKLKELESK